MKLTIEHQLLFARAQVEYRGQTIQIDHLLIDTGSGGTILAADKLAPIGITPEPNDKIRRIVGVGGAEFVFEKPINRIVVGDLTVENFTVEVGALNYGFQINGIIGLDFLIETSAVIDLSSLELKLAHC